MSIEVNKNRCPENHPCPIVRVCPTKAIKQNGFSAPTIDKSKCVDCGRCLRFCAYGAFVRS